MLEDNEKLQTNPGISGKREAEIMKKWLFLITAILLLLVLMICSAAAAGEKPTGGMKEREVIAEDNTTVNSDGSHDSMGSYCKISGPTSCKTGKTYTWKISDKYSDGYNFIMAVLDGSYPNANTADVQYDGGIQTGKSFSYTFWFPGTYVLFVDALWYFDDWGYYCWETVQLTIKVSNAGENTVTRMIKNVAAEQKADNEFQTVLNLHNWILDHCTYDYTYTWYSADSIFLLETGVCNSYARAFTLLLKAAGIESRRVSGYAFGDPDAGHAWSAVKINGKWYLFDLTWDDSGDSMDEFTRYQYFAVPEECFSMEHTPRKYVGGKVKCTSLADNYFIHTGKWTNYAELVLNEYRDYQDQGMHNFLLDAQDYGDDGYDYTDCLFGMVTTYGLNHYSYPDSSGRILPGTFEYDGYYMIKGSHNHQGTLTLPSGISEVSGELFSSTPATCVIIQDGCEAIAPNAFEGMDLWEIHIPESVEEISLDSFADNRDSLVLIISPEGSPAYQFAEDHGDDGFIWLPE